MPARNVGVNFIFNNQFINIFFAYIDGLESAGTLNYTTNLINNIIKRICNTNSIIVEVY
jgi:hypothetical protein